MTNHRFESYENFHIRFVTVGVLSDILLQRSYQKVLQNAGDSDSSTGGTFVKTGKSAFEMGEVKKPCQLFKVMY